MRGYFCFTLFYLLFALFGVDSNAQIFAPNRNWVSPTNYANSTSQDSVFLFFENNLPNIRAQFSDSSASTYTWYKYNRNFTVPSGASLMQRFRPLISYTDSIIPNVEAGGYMVDVKRTVDDSVETYIAWVMVDNITIESLGLVSNTCSNLQLILKTAPVSAFDVNSKFAYYDISRDAHQEISILGSGGYFAVNTFQSLNPKVTVSSPIHHSLIPFIFIEFVNPKNGKTHGPLYDAAYKFTLTTPFGRGQLVVQSPEIKAVSTKADFEISFWDDDISNFGSVQTADIPNGEALLRMKLESKSINTDSLYWNINNDKLRFAKGGDSIVWSHRSLPDDPFAEPDPKKMIPGFYGVEHISVKRTDGVVCRDALLRTVEVDTSFIRNIPNVFTPGGTSPIFKISEDDLHSLRSFKIVIVNRTGQQVYRYAGDPKQWEGWNGKIDGTKGDAPSGVYYFVIDAVGWDGVRYRDGQYKGFLHLYR